MSTWFSPGLAGSSVRACRVRLYRAPGILPGFNSQTWAAPDDGVGLIAFTYGARNGMMGLPGETAGLLEQLLGVSHEGPSDGRSAPPGDLGRSLRLVSGSRHEYWKPLVALLATSGLRISEALGLRRRDLDLADGMATVRQTVVEVEGKLILTTPKSMASRRAVKLIQSVVSMLKHQALPLDQDGFVFTQPGKADPLARTWFNRRVLKPAALQAGISPSMSAHDLRDTAGAITSKTGMHPMAVKEMMGPSSIRVTYDVYGHLFPTMHEAGTAAVEAAFSTAFGARGGDAVRRST